LLAPWKRFQPAGRSGTTVRLAIARIWLKKDPGPDSRHERRNRHDKTPQPPFPKLRVGKPPGERIRAKTRRRVGNRAWLPNFTTRSGDSNTPQLFPWCSSHTVEPAARQQSGLADPGRSASYRAKWARAIITALLATCREGEVDFEKLIEWLADAGPLERIPRLPWPTIRRGAMYCWMPGPLR